MKKRLLLCQIILIAAFVLFAALTTTFTLLDAFVLDREVFDPKEEITQDPTFTLLPPTQHSPETSPKTAPETTVLSTPDSTVSIETGTAVSGTTAITSKTPTTVKTPTTTEAPIEYPIVSERYYKDENIEIDIQEKHFYNNYRGSQVETRYFVIDLKLSDIEYLQTHFRQKNGKVTKATTSELAKDVDAIFAINGDYFSFREYGFVVRNYTTFRDSARPSKSTSLNGDDTLFILPNGSLMMFDENDSLFKNGLPSDIYQAFSFGPRLIENNAIMVNEKSEVGQSSTSNPRTAIGMIEPLHYIIIVSEGRLTNGDGMTLYKLANIMKDLGCKMAYNLDGGSSTTLYFNGEVINTPGRSDGSERDISDIIYINGKKYSDG